MSGDPYVIPGTTVLQNKLGLRDQAGLDYHERALVVQRARQGVPTGRFDLPHLQAIHRHLFQDVYEWAGQLRTVEIAKGSSHFQARRYIPTGFADVHRRLAAARLLRRLPAPAFAAQAGRIMGDVNYVHPFREGNGRAQLQYLRQLAEQAGHPVDLRRLTAPGWLHASIEAQDGRHGAMAEAIQAALLGGGTGRVP